MASGKPCASRHTADHCGYSLENPRWLPVYTCRPGWVLCNVSRRPEVYFATPQRTMCLVREGGKCSLSVYYSLCVPIYLSKLSTGYERHHYAAIVQSIHVRTGSYSSATRRRAESPPPLTTRQWSMPAGESLGRAAHADRDRQTGRNLMEKDRERDI